MIYSENFCNIIYKGSKLEVTDMNNKQSKEKQIMTPEKIYKIMQWLPVGVASIFFLINLIKGNTPAIIVIGLCLLAFIGVSVISNKRKLDLYKKEYILAIALPTLVFLISLFSGASYSDDFPLFLAVIAMTGMFLEPQFTRTQMVLADVYLVIMYIVHPEKSGGLSQYVLCMACFTLATALFYQVIKRGRAFIQINDNRAKDSEALLNSVRTMGMELQHDFHQSASRIDMSTQGLKKESAMIARGAGEVSDGCNVVLGKLKETEEQIGQMNEGVRAFEEALRQNRGNVDAMKQQVNAVSETISESSSTFRTMEEQMNEIAGIARQINDISFKLTILSLNASVEAAHAGEAESGFEVVANEMRALSETSAGFSAQVSEVVKELLAKVEITSQRVTSSDEALTGSEETMSNLLVSFERLNEQFEILYNNIENQNNNVNQIHHIFGELNHKAAQMHSSSLANEDAVENIVDAMTVFRDNVGKIVKNTQDI